MAPILTKTMAEVYIEQGHLEEAHEILRVLSERDPADAEVQKRLADVRQRLGLSSTGTLLSGTTAEEKVRMLERWLTSIRERKKS